MNPSQPFRTEIRQVFLFLLVGGLSTVLNYLGFWVLLERFHLHYVLSSWAGYFMGVCLGFLLNARYTFNSGQNMRKYAPLLYLGSYVCSLALSTLTLYALVTYLRISPKISNVVAIAQSTTTNYLGCKFFVFRKPKPDAC